MTAYFVGSRPAGTRSHVSRHANATRWSLRIAVALTLIVAVGACLYWDLGVVMGFALLPRLLGAPLNSAPPISEWMLCLGAPWALAGFLAWSCAKWLKTAP